MSDEKRHSYSDDGLTLKKSLRSSYDASPVVFREKPRLPPPAPSSAGLADMKEFAKIKAQRMSHSKSPSHVTVQYDRGTPSLHIRFSQVELPTPAVISRDIKSPTNESLVGYRKAHEYPTSSAHDHTIESENLYRYGAHPYGDSSSESSQSLYSPSVYGANDTPRTSRTLGYGPADLPDVLEPPLPAYFATPTQRSSDYSQISDLSAAQAEIIDTPRRKLSFLNRKSAVARAMLYPVPSTKVAMTLSGTESSPVTSPARPQNPTDMMPRSTIDERLPATRRPSPLPVPPVQQSPAPVSQVSQTQRQQASTTASAIRNHASGITIDTTAPSFDSAGYSSDEPNARSSTLQAMRELAEQFPGPPPGAVVANIGIQAATINRRNEERSTGHGFNQSRNGSSHGHGTSIAGSTDTDEAIRRRIPANVKMKGRQAASPTPSIPLPPLPSQGLPRTLPRQPPHMLSLEQVLSQAQAPPTPFTAQPIDPFEDDDTMSHPETTTELSPLTMSVKLRHPQSFISTMYPPSTRRNSKATTAGIMSPAPTFSPSFYSQGLSRGPSTFGQKSPSILDFGAALKEWNLAGLQTMGVGAPMHRRSLSAQTRDEFERQQQKYQKNVALTSELDLSYDPPDQLHQPQQPATRTTGRAPLNRIKSIGKAPQRTTPRPVKSPYARESMHLQPLVIPDSPQGQDVPVSAVEAGGVSQTFDVNKAGVNTTLEEQDELMPMSAVTEGTHGGGIMRSLTILDGGHVPIRLQRSKKELY